VLQASRLSAPNPFSLSSTYLTSLWGASPGCLQASVDYWDASDHRKRLVNVGKEPPPCGAPPFRASPVASGVAVSSLCSIDHFAPTPVTSCLSVSHHRPRHRAAAPAHYVPARPWAVDKATVLGQLTGPGRLRPVRRFWVGPLRA
jgi:hypothetical protein